MNAQNDKRLPSLPNDELNKLDEYVDYIVWKRWGPRSERRDDTDPTDWDKKNGVGNLGDVGRSSPYLRSSAKRFVCRTLSDTLKSVRNQFPEADSEYVMLQILAQIRAAVRQSAKTKGKTMSIEERIFVELVLYAISHLEKLITSKEGVDRQMFLHKLWRNDEGRLFKYLRVEPVGKGRFVRLWFSTLMAKFKR